MKQKLKSWNKIFDRNDSLSWEEKYGEQEFVLRGNIEGMIKILQKDFNVPYDEAKFIVYSLLSQSDTKKLDKEELVLWYLADKEKYNKYNEQIFNRHYAINFTMTKMTLFHMTYMFLVKYIFQRGIDFVLIGADLVYLIYSSIKKIKDTDYCVFSRIIELNIGIKGKFFSISDIVTANKDGKCDYQEDNWKCTYMAQNENCTCNEKKVELALKKLSEQNIIKPVGDYWILIQ